MMKLSVNGREVQVEEGITGLQLLEQLDRNSSTLVIERNGSIIPLKEFHTLTLADGDELELVTLVGGG